MSFDTIAKLYQKTIIRLIESQVALKKELDQYIGDTKYYGLRNVIEENEKLFKEIQELAK